MIDTSSWHYLLLSKKDLIKILSRLIFLTKKESFLIWLWLEKSDRVCKLWVVRLWSSIISIDANVLVTIEVYLVMSFISFFILFRIFSTSVLMLTRRLKRDVCWDRKQRKRYQLVIERGKDDRMTYWLVSIKFSVLVTF